MNAPHPTKSVAVFAVADVRKTVEFYKDVLDFTEHWFWNEDPPGFGGACWGDIQVMFNQQPHLAGKLTGHQHSFFVSGVDELYRRHQSKGAKIVADIENKPWGLREYTLEDINGYHLRFGEATSECDPDKPRPLPPGVKILKRKPGLAEYRTLNRAVGWDRYTNPDMNGESIKAALFGITAELGKKTIGCGLVLGDGVSFFYIKDLMVLPEHQEEGIGTAIMDELMAWLDEHAPNKALIGLFTGRNLKAYYERFGFKGSEDFLYGMGQRRHAEKLGRSGAKGGAKAVSNPAKASSKKRVKIKKSR